MDDLLIVRMVDRSKERFSRKARSANTPVGMHIGLVVGIGIGLMAASITNSSPLFGITIGTVFGLVFGTIAGRLLKPKRRYERIRPAYSYEGMPIENEEGDESEDPSPENDQ